MAGTSRFAYIDSARAIAASLVVWQHAAAVGADLAPQVSNRWMADIPGVVDLGRIGVIVFFAISGYVIPGSLDPADRAAGRKFLIRRFFRLFPAYWLSLPLGWIALWAIYGRHLPASDIALNLTMAPSLFGATEIIGLYWTLAYELAFYAMCLGLWRCGLLARAWTTVLLCHLALAGGAILLLASIYTTKPEFSGWALSCFFYGVMFTGAAWRRWRDGAMTGRGERLALLGVLLVWFLALPLGCAGVLAVSGRRIDYFVEMPLGYVVGLLIFVLLTTVAKIGWRPLAWLGLVSYSLYLFHPVVLYALQRLGQLWPPARLDLALFVALEFALAIALSAAIFHCVERPAIGLGRRLSGRPARAALAPAEEAI